MDNREGILNRVDYSLLFILFLFFCTSCYTLYAAQLNHLVSGSYLKEQIILYIISFPFFVIAMFIDLDVIERLSKYIYLICIVLMIGILIAPNSIAPELNGAKGWYRLGSLSFQPAEFMKIGLILVLSGIVTKSHNTQILESTKDELLLAAKMFLYVIPLIYFSKEFPDMGSLLVYLAIFFTILLVSKIRMKTILLICVPFAAILLFCVIAYFFFPDFFFNTLLAALPKYQAERFYGWLDPSRYTNSEGYQLQNALITIGSGQFGGTRIASSLVPYAYSDFIFTIIGGVRGFIGASALIMIYFVLIYKILKIGLNHHDIYGRTLCAGIVGMIGYQVFQNIGMTVGLLPITGLSLPFISYGGSSLMINLFALGLVSNIKMNTYKYMFS
ncbi:MAG: FtsW/RodA/SpoVE family cell cycle protein [Sporolactobacillus sp.]